MSYESWGSLDWGLASAFAAAIGIIVGRAWERENGPEACIKRSMREGERELERILALPDDEAHLAMAQRLIEVSEGPEDLEARLRAMEASHLLAEQVREGWRSSSRGQAAEA